MPVVTLGLSHKTAPLEIRERVVFNDDSVQPALAELRGELEASEAALISTCNRTEIYALFDDEAPLESLQHWLARSHHLEPGWLQPYLYSYVGREAVNQLLTVAAGLDSLVLGEPQILGQTKAAYQQAVAAGTLGRALERLFQHAFSAAKQVRSQTAIGDNPVSVAYAAVSLARQIFGDMDRRTALLIGAGETIELSARHLKEQGLKRLLIANRSLEKAQKLAQTHGGEGIALGDIPQVLDQADIVVASTASTLPLLGKGSVERALKRRKHRPMFMVDVAVPRDIEPEVGELSDVYLYTIDDLRAVVEDNLRSRQAAAIQAQEIVDAQVERFMDWLRAQDAVAAIRRWRAHGDEVRDETLEKALQRLQKGESAEEAMRYLANTLTKKLLHHPTVGLREAAASGDAERLRAARNLLQLPPEEDDSTP